MLKVLTAYRIFHKVKFGTRKAFGIVFEMGATTKSLSSSQMAKRYSIKLANRLVIHV
ncbi:transposase [Flavobacterium gilvum]|nr:transposase [Flavobacterium gilvum]